MLSVLIWRFRILCIASQNSFDCLATDGRQKTTLVAEIQRNLRFIFSDKLDNFCQFDAK